MVKDLKKDLKKLYKKRDHRYQHVMGVMETGLELAEIYGVDKKKVKIAALLHDYTKYYSTKKHKKLIKKHFGYADLILDEFPETLYHAFTASIIAKEKYGIDDEEILMAIMHHTVGRPNMSMLEKIIFISDYIEPNREYDSCKKVRKIVLKKGDLNKGILKAMKDSIENAEKKNKLVPKLAKLAYNYYLEECEASEEN